MATTRDELIFHGVRVIQSLPEGETPTAHKLLDDVLNPISYRNPHVHVMFEKVDTAAQLIEQLSATLQHVQQTGRNPILHVEAHGNRLGLVMANGDLVRWSILSDALRSINRQTRFNLLLVLGACFGAHFTETLLPTFPSPVWAVVGPQEKVCNLDLLASYKAFYTELLGTFDGTKALDAAMAEMPRGLQDFAPYTALFTFKVGFQILAKHANDQDAVRQRSEKKARQLVSERPELSGQFNQIVEQFVAKASDPEASFEECRSTYFMYEDIPENRARFGIEFKDCFTT